jgi:hypothetical protein
MRQGAAGLAGIVLLAVGLSGCDGNPASHSTHSAASSSHSSCHVKSLDTPTSEVLTKATLGVTALANQNVSDAKVRQYEGSILATASSCFSYSQDVQGADGVALTVYFQPGKQRAAQVKTVASLIRSSALFKTVATE